MADLEDGAVAREPAATRAKPAHVDDDLPPHADDAPNDAPNSAPNGGAKPAGGTPGGQAADEDQAIPGNFINFAQFNSNFTAPDAFFGVGDRSDPGRRKATGWVDAAEIDATLKSFVHPRPCFNQAAEALDGDRVVVLTAPSGSGKRSGAIALLRGFTENDRCVVLSPDLTLEDLAKRHFSSGLGYVLLDRFNEPVAQPDFAWRQVRDRVRADDAFLVVTSVHQLAKKPDTVKHIDWRAPEPKQVLEKRLRDTEPALADRAIAAMPGDCTLRDVVAVADLILAGTAPEDAWERHGGNAVQAVRDWFLSGRTLSDFTAITTLAFAVGSNRRMFETLKQRLDDRLQSEKENAGFDDEETKPDTVFGTVYEGRRQLRDNPLVATQNLADGAVNRSVLVFSDPRYRRWVLEELWETCPTPFWDAVRDWLTAEVEANTDPQLEFAVATGLAQLARSTFDEVVESYLDPWAAGRAGAAGKALAVQVLWCMCLDEELAGAALSVARGWVESGGLALRSTAVVAFGGMLGVRFPSVAVRRLWNQVEHGGQAGGVARERLGYLFAALVECEEDATVVTELLRHRLRKQRQGAVPDSLKKTTFRAVLGLLQFRDWDSGRPVCAVALAHQPALTPDLADLFTGVLVNRLYRTEAKETLMKVVKALAATGPGARETARRFGLALGAALPPHERTLLVDVLGKQRRDAARKDDLVGVFLGAVLTSEDWAKHG